MLADLYRDVPVLSLIVTIALFTATFVGTALAAFAVSSFGKKAGDLRSVGPGVEAPPAKAAKAA